MVSSSSYWTNGSFPNQTSINVSQTINATISPKYGESPRGRQYENDTIPLWGFNSTCEWMAAVYVDLAVSTLSVTYNTAVFLFLFFVDRLHGTQAAILGSYTVGCFICSVYYIYFDINMLVGSNVVVSKAEKGMLYVLMLFLAYHLVLHTYLLSWDQYRSVFRCKSHVRYLTNERLVKIGVIIWFGSVVLSILEAIFLNNVSGFPQTKHVSEFRMVCVLLLLFFFWFLPLVIMICWNGDLFCFLLKVAHNGYVVQEPEEPGFKPEIMPELAPCPWFSNVGGVAPQRNNDGSSFIDEADEEEDELPTVPDDVRFELSRCFVHLVMTTAFGVPTFVWLTYNLLAIMRTGKRLTEGWEKEFYESIYSCYLFICLYFASKILVILNPLCCYYYRPEIREMISRVVLRLRRAPENLAQFD